MWILFVSSGFIIRSLWEDEKVAENAFKYIIWSFPSIFMVGLLDVQRKFLTQVDKTSLSLKVLIPGLLLHVLWNYIFVWYLDLGIMGTAIAMFITDFTNFIGLYIATSLQKDLKDALSVSIMDPKVTMQMKEYWKMAFPAMVVYFFGWSTL